MRAGPKPIQAGPIVFIIVVASLGGLTFYQLVYLPYLAPQDICVKFPEICNPPQKVLVRIVINAFIPTNPQDYVPDVLVVYLGVNNTVTWINEDTVAHTVTDDNNRFDSQLLQPGQSWTYTFKARGIYTYHCIPHPYMKAKVVVCDSSGCPQERP